MSTKKKSHSVKPGPSPSVANHTIIETVIAEPRKLVTAEAVEQAIDLKRPALYRLARAKRVPVYRLGREKGLRFVVSEVLDAIRQPKVTTGDE